MRFTGRKTVHRCVCEELTPEIISTLTDDALMNVIYEKYADVISVVVFSHISKFKVSTEEIEDCIFTVIEKIISNGCSKLRKFRGESGFKTYLSSVCGNLAMDYTRKMTRINDPLVIDGRIDDNLISEEESPDVVRHSENPLNMVVAKEERMKEKKACSAVFEAMKEMEEFDRVLLDMKFLRKMTLKEMDFLLGIDNSAYCLKKAVDKLERILGEKMKMIQECLFGEAS